MPITSARRKLFQQLASTSTCHGLNRAAIHDAEGNLKLRSLWTVLTLAALTAFTGHLISLVHRYLSFPITTYVEVSGVDFSYPTVTVCNRKLLSVSYIKDYDYKLKRWKKGFKPNWQRFRSYNEDLQDAVWLLIDEIAGGQLIHYGNHAHKIPEVRPESELTDRILRDSAESVNVSLLDFNNQAAGLIVECRVGKVRCSHRDFVEIRHPRYLRCFTFNHSLFFKAAEHLQMQEADRKTGAALLLKLILYTDSYPAPHTLIDSKEDFFRLREFGGVDVQVHFPYSFPHINNFVHASAGMETSLQVQYYEQIRLPAYTNPCKSAQTTETHAECVMEKTIRRVSEMCKCRMFEHPLSNDEGSHQLPLCFRSGGTLTSRAVRSCFHESENNNTCIALIKTVNDIFENDACVQRVVHQRTSLSRECIPPCVGKRFLVSETTSVWPQRHNPHFLFEEMKHDKGFAETMRAKNTAGLFHTYHLRNDSDDVRYITENLARVTVAPQRVHPSKRTVENLAYPLVNLFSDIGGILGLWIGVSVLTLCELAELLALFTVGWCLRRQHYPGNSAYTAAEDHNYEDDHTLKNIQ